jgi:hypothetical protein
MLPAHPPRVASHAAGRGRDPALGEGVAAADRSRQQTGGESRLLAALAPDRHCDLRRVQAAAPRTQSSRRPGRRDRVRGERAVSSPMRAAARRPPGASCGPACASPGRRSRPAGRGETAERAANHSSRVEPADACFRDCISAAWQLLTVAPMLRPRRAMCVRHRLLAVVRTKVGKHWIAPRLMLCLWKQRCCSSNTDFEHHRLSHRPGDAAVSRPTTRRALVVVQTDSVVECRGRGWSRRRSGSRRAPAARPALLPCLPHPSALAGTWHVELRRGEPAGVALAIRPQRGVSHP